MNRHMARRPLLEIDGRPVYEEDLMGGRGQVVMAFLILLIVVGLGVIEMVIG